MLYNLIDNPSSSFISSASYDPWVTRVHCLSNHVFIGILVIVRFLKPNPVTRYFI